LILPIITNYIPIATNRKQKISYDLIHQLQPVTGSSIIDVGCGNGRHCKYLAEKGFHATGIDLAFHMTAIRNMSEALKSGGVLVLDYLNPVYVEKHLVASEYREIDGIAYHITRWADEQHIYKKIAIVTANRSV
jgi:2-polyprenyl-3-methyl-5-hydroxy-6-metoxy-1,4-benzoquinol methylase